VLTDVGAVDLAVPRDRNGSFEPQIVRKSQTRLEGFNDRIIALYARGMTVRDIRAHLPEMYDVDVSPGLISRVTTASWRSFRTGSPGRWAPATARSTWPSGSTARALSRSWADDQAAAAALGVFAGTWPDRYPAIVKVWRAHWEQFAPFLAFPPEVRRVIYTTNLIESVNSRLRTTGGPTPGSAAPGGKEHSRRSRSTSRAGSRAHDRHDHLHKPIGRSRPRGNSGTFQFRHGHPIRAPMRSASSSVACWHALE
jgi:hypothetical protein